MQRVRKVVEGGDLIVLQKVDTFSHLGGSNAMYLLEYFEYGQSEHETAVGRAVMERVEDILAGKTAVSGEQEEVVTDG